ncbi:hypothetical protein NFJ02_09g143400 [Pycnococcus provasolii]
MPTPTDRRAAFPYTFAAAEASSYAMRRKPPPPHASSSVRLKTPPTFLHHEVDASSSSTSSLDAWASGDSDDSESERDQAPHRRVPPGMADGDFTWKRASPSSISPRLAAKLDRLKRPTEASVDSQSEQAADYGPAPAQQQRPPPQFTPAERRRATGTLNHSSGADARTDVPVSPDDIARPSPAEKQLAAALARLSSVDDDFAVDAPPRSAVTLRAPSLDQEDELTRREQELRAALADVGRARARLAFEEDSSRLSAAAEEELVDEERVIAKRCDDAVAALVVERARWGEQFKHFRSRVHEGMAKLQAALDAAAEKESSLEQAYTEMEEELRAECGRERSEARRRAEERLERRLAEAARAMGNGVGLAEASAAITVAPEFLRGQL